MSAGSRFFSAAAVVMLIVGLAVGVFGGSLASLRFLKPENKIETVTETVAEAPTRVTTSVSTTTLTETRVTTATRTLSTTSTTTVTILAHRIGVRLVDGAGEFYNRKTGEKFVPRGNNYIRVADQRDCREPGVIYHSTFNPGLYEPARAERALAKMREEGYNVVRIFINHLCVVDATGSLSKEYLSNIADFLRRAKANEIFVIFAIDDPPDPGYASRIPHHPDIDWPNSKFLTQAGVDVERQFWKDFIRGLMNQNAPLDYIFAYALRNEAFLFGNIQPFSSASGLVTTGNGRSYDMGKPEDKQRMMDENLVYWIEKVRASILEVDPTALVTIGFFWPQKPNPARIGDPRIIRTRSAIWESLADFIDLHAYPGVELTMPQYVQNFEIDGFSGKPILMGEFGSFRSSHWSSALAAQTLQNWQVESCKHGFDGWLLWTWDTDEQPELWSGLADGEIINQALSTKNRPDPCTPGPFSGQNMASGKPATASRFLASNPASMAFDGSINNWWGAGAFSPQWIEVNLQSPSSIKKIRLVVSQSPSGDTVHRVWGKGSDVSATYQQLHEFRGFTKDGQVLEYSPPTPWTDIQFIKVETVTNPSWVAWREIEILRA